MKALKVLPFILDGTGVAIIVISFLTNNMVAPWFAIGLGFMLVSTLVSLMVARWEHKSLKWELAVIVLLAIAMSVSLYTYFLR